MSSSLSDLSSSHRIAVYQTLLAQSYANYPIVNSNFSATYTTVYGGNSFLGPAATHHDPTWETACPERPLVGWRVWAVPLKERPWRLHSVHFTNVWMPGVRMWGKCKCPPHTLFSCTDAHSCGIYACQERAGPSPTEVSSGFIPIIGTVWLWGHIIEHAHGWKAEFAYPKAVGGDFPEVAREIAATYKCDIL